MKVYSAIFHEMKSFKLFILTNTILAMCPTPLTLTMDNKING